MLIFYFVFNFIRKSKELSMIEAFIKVILRFEFALIKKGSYLSIRAISIFHQFSEL